MSINAFSLAVPLSLPVVALESAVLLAAILALAVCPLPLPLLCLMRSASAGRRAVELPVIAPAAKGKFDAAATALEGPKVHARSSGWRHQLDIAG